MPTLIHGVRRTSILREEAGAVVEGRSSSLLGREVVELAGRRSVLTPLVNCMSASRKITRRGVQWGAYAALQRASIDVVAIQLANSHRGVLMRVHLDEREATVSLETSLKDISEVLEQGHEVVLRGVGGEIANVAGSLPLRGLLHNHVVALNTLGREMVVTKGSSRGHAHSGHRLLLGDRRLSLLVGPVAANSTRAEPLAIHRVQSLVSIGAVTEGDEAVATGATSLHIPHHTSFGDGTKGGESLGQDLIIHLIAQVTDEDVEVVGGVLLAGAVGLVGPVDADFLRGGTVSKFNGTGTRCFGFSVPRNLPTDGCGAR